MQPYVAVREATVRRVLLLDDHEGSRFGTRCILMLLGYDCNAVGSTVAALAAVETYQPDVIIYEWYVRSESRAGLSVRLREHAAATYTHPLQVIVLSTFDEPARFQEHEQIDAYLTKPLRKSALEAVLLASRSTTCPT